MRLKSLRLKFAYFPLLLSPGETRTTPVFYVF
uniref:Uncharacterized protein n=1 Tax=Anguilla anguilla TaxID=7936 RepID=A0A0E9SL09_ANGAN